ncbi:MAG TPA: hypothetical protein VN620_16015, partial [Candidatus Methylomirabilis sp.]|nr:hypothetical protein [Candidatus Methylomirabilis sp.]
LPSPAVADAMGFGEGFVGVFFAATFFAGIAVFAFDNGFAAFVGRRAGVLSMVSGPAKVKPCWRTKVRP